MKKIKRETLGDAVIVLTVLIVCLVWFLASHTTEKSTSAVIYTDGEVYQEIDLQDAQRTCLKVNGTEIEIDNGRIRFLSSDCPDKLCVKSGWLSEGSDTAACVPNKTVIVIEKTKAPTFHAVTY